MSTPGAAGAHAAHGARPATAAASEMTPADLKARLAKGEKIVILDARSNLNGQILKGAVHVPVAKLADWAKDKDKTTVVVTYCTCPADEAAINEVELLQRMGFEHAYALKGGMNAARAAGIEVVAPTE